MIDEHYPLNSGIYSLAVLTSFLVGLFILKQSKEEALSIVKVKYVLPVFLVGAIIGAKIPVILSYGWHKEFFLTGKSYYGALIGAFIAINIYKYVYKIKEHFGGRLVVPLAVGAGIGKIGCFFYGCCSGTETDFFIKIQNVHGQYVHPVQLYESFFEFLMAAVFYCYYRKKAKMPPEAFLMYLLSYMIFRFLIEFIRIEPKVYLGLSVYQLMSIVFVPVFMFELFRRLRNAK
ncbi:MAG: prolipoprotein diacylglyceryl transferase [Alphaproteobacteria bacterium]